MKKSVEQITKEVYEIAKEFSSTKQKPYISVLQPRRSLKETPAQQLQDWKNRMIDLTSVAVSYHAIDGNPVDSARCWLMNKAIEDDPEYALFIDEDTALPFFGVSKMIETSKQFPNAVISGIYYVKFGNVMMSVLDSQQRWVLPDVTPNSGPIRNVMSTGLGCALIPMHIIKTIQKKYEDIPLFCIVPEHTWKDKDVTFIGEDTWFFNLVKKCGFEIIGDTSCHCIHMELKTGKYQAHPDVKLSDYITNIPITEPLTMEDRIRVSKEYIERICKPTYHIEEGLRPSARLLQKSENIIAAEIGVYQGENAENLLKELKIKTLYLIDSYEPYDKVQEENDPDPAVSCDIAHKRLEQYRNIEWIQEKSEDAFEGLKNIQFDYIYIDGDHRYEIVKKDIELYFQLIKKGGILAGHDYHQDYRPEVHAGVTKAVDEFRSQKGLYVYSDKYDWWIIK